RSPFEQLAREQARKRRDSQLHLARRSQFECLDQRGADARVVTSHVVHPEAAEQVEKLRSIRVVEVGAFRAPPAAVEADRPQQADELRVDRPRVQVELLAPMLVEQLSQIHAVVVLGRETIRTETIPLRRIQRAASVSSHSPAGQGRLSSTSREPIRIPTARCAETSAGSNRMCALASVSVTSTTSGLSACSTSHEAGSVIAAGSVPSTPRAYKRRAPCLGVNTLARRAQATTLAAGPDGQDLGENRQRRLTRSPRSQVEPGRPAEPIELLFRHA